MIIRIGGGDNPLLRAMAQLGDARADTRSVAACVESRACVIDGVPPCGVGDQSLVVVGRVVVSVVV